jgi:excisionase family DNA binding protein
MVVMNFIIFNFDRKELIMKTMIPQKALYSAFGAVAPFVPGLTAEKFEQMLCGSFKSADLRPGYTIKELSKLLKCSRQSIYNMECRGDIKLLRIGGIVRIDREQVEILLSQGTGSPEAQPPTQKEV